MAEVYCWVTLRMNFGDEIFATLVQKVSESSHNWE